jgi:hypothetical protein
MSRIVRLLAIAVGLLFILFAIVVAAYAGEPFNIATLFGVVGVGMLVQLRRKRPRPAEA